MLRLSRPTAFLLIAAGLLSALSECERRAEESDASPLPAAPVRLAPWLSEEARRLDGRVALAVARSRQVDELAGEVAAGRVSLLDGAARLRDIYRATPDFAWERFREGHPGASDDERFCRLLIERVEGVLWEDRSQAQAAADRLEAELEAQLASGTLRLPE
jgi:hypothetical protein